MPDLLDRIREEGHPLIDGSTATFVWQGEQAAALINDLHNWEANPQPLLPAGQNLWSLSIDLPDQAYLEYAFIDPRDGTRLVDPFNPRRIWNGISAYNHFFYLPGGGPTPLVKRKRSIAHGTVTRFDVDTSLMAIGRKRRIDLYQPPVEGPVPLLVVFDGADYLKRARLVNIVDNLIAQQRIRPLALALLQNAGQGRMVEYGASELTLVFLRELVLPLARENLELLDIDAHPGSYGVMGASMGGLMALYTGLRLPHIFGKVLSQSGAFHLWGHETVPVELVRHGPKQELDIWMDVGLLEWLLESNRSMHALLRERGYAVEYREFPGGHNYTAWADDLWRGLEALFA